MMRQHLRFQRYRRFFAAAFLLLMAGPINADRSEAEAIDENGTIHVPAYDLPISEFVSDKTRAGILRSLQASQNNCPGGRYPGRNADETLAMRKCADERGISGLVELRERFNVDIRPETIGGVYTEVITPADGVSDRNRARVLLNLHGGGFELGGRGKYGLLGGQRGSIPIASLGRFKVITVDYRMFPEHVFPAATDDVLAVYREVLKTYKPGNVGIYGCSAGGLLTAQVLARLQIERLPNPGAVGMQCAGGTIGGDGYVIMAPIEYAARGGVGVKKPEDLGYLAQANRNDPLVFPSHHPSVLAKFPPSILFTGTRDRALSSVVYTHSELVRLGVEAELLVWEGLGHGAFLDPAIPEHDYHNDILIRFFNKHLGLE